MFLGQIRRQFLIFFMQGYIKKQLQRRHGACRQCATCCSFTCKCPMLIDQSNCRNYEGYRPRVCSLFPITKADINDVKACGGNCGFWFE